MTIAWIKRLENIYIIFMLKGNEKVFMTRITRKDCVLWKDEKILLNNNKKGVSLG